MLIRRLSLTILASMPALLAASIPAAADEGMWLLNRPPAQLLEQKYGFEPAPAWLEHVQKSCVRFGSGGSGSIVSSQGLVMTNHHVGADMLEKLSTPDLNLLERGFYAARREDELKCPDLELLCLWSIEDVSARVDSAAAPGLSPADANTARRKRIAEIEQESKDATGFQSEVVTLYHGARYHLYRYKRYTDVRLVFAPEQQIAFFGGDTDNFEYPRFNLDVCFFRIYENDRPLVAQHYLRWSRTGAADGDLTFVAGHPARTRRLLTVDHLRFLRDVELPTILRRLWRREVQLHGFAARNDEFARIANGDIKGVENSRKAFTGVLAGLHDPAIMNAKLAAERKLRDRVNEKPEYREQWASAWDQVAAAQNAYRAFYERHTALEGRRAVIRSDLYHIARHLVRLAAEKPKPSPDRLREYRDSELESLELELYSPAPIYDDLEIDRIASGLSYLAESFGADDPLVVRALAGRLPRDRAEALVRGTKLKDVEVRRKIATGGIEAIATSTDPMIRFAADIDPEALALRRRHEDEIESVERDAYARIAAAQFALNGEDMYPDATYSLRLSFGPVRGYREAGRDIPPFTTFAGLYERMEQRHAAPPFDLPQRWLDAKSRLKLDTPFNFVTTGDITGGNSGSPVVDTKGEVVGIVFDGNIHGLVWDIAYTDEQARCVAVDARGIIEALRKVYAATALANELLGQDARSLR